MTITLPAVTPLLLRVPYQSAQWVLSHMRPGGRIVGCRKSAFNLTDLIDAAVERTGPAHLLAASWATTDEDMLRIRGMLDAGRLLSVRLVVPFPTSTDGAEYERMRGHFGAENVIHSQIHAKIACLENDAWHLAIRGSLNMAPTCEVESFDLDDSLAICDTLRAHAAAPQLQVRPENAGSSARARAGIAVLAPGVRIFGLTDGYGSEHLLDAILERTGPAEVSICATYLGPKQLRRFAAENVRILMGRAGVLMTKARDRGSLAAIPIERIRIHPTHVKMIVVRNDAWSVVVRSSMNFCPNPRTEHFDLTEDRDVARMALGWIDEVFERTPPGIHTSANAMRKCWRASLCGSSDGTDAARAVSVLGVELAHREPPFPSEPTQPQPVRLPPPPVALDLRTFGARPPATLDLPRFTRPRQLDLLRTL